MWRPDNPDTEKSGYKYYGVHLRVTSDLGHSPSAREDILLQMRPFHMKREFLSDQPTWQTRPFISLFKYLDNCIVLHEHVNYDYTSILQSVLSFWASTQNILIGRFKN